MLLLGIFDGDHHQKGRGEEQLTAECCSVWQLRTSVLKADHCSAPNGFKLKRFDRPTQGNSESVRGNQTTVVLVTFTLAQVVCC